MSRTELKDAAGISFNVLAKMGKNEFVSMDSLYKISQTLSCDIGEVVEFVNSALIDFAHRQVTSDENQIGLSWESIEISRICGRTI